MSSFISSEEEKCRPTFAARLNTKENRGIIGGVRSVRYGARKENAMEMKSGFLFLMRKKRVKRLTVALVVAVALTIVLAPVPAHALSPATFVIGDTSHVGTFYTSDYKNVKNTIYYEVKKEINVIVPQVPRLGYADTMHISLERLDGSTWMSIDKKRCYVSETGGSKYLLTYIIRQETSTKTQYQFRLAASESLDISETVSPIFTIEGVKQNPGLSVEYNKGSQRYNKTPVTLTIKTTAAYTGKAVVYDGKKKLKTLSLKSGKPITYNLPKKLKRGKHKISVKFTPGGEFTPFYNTVTSKTKTVTVKK
jgi:hypothetical protein